MQSLLWGGAGAGVAIAALAIWRDRRHSRRADLDRVGLVPWPSVLIAAILLAAICAALALKTG